jgi:hypothetical protein
MAAAGWRKPKKHELILWAAAVLVGALLSNFVAARGKKAVICTVIPQYCSSIAENLAHDNAAPRPMPSGAANAYQQAERFDSALRAHFEAARGQLEKPEASRAEPVLDASSSSR